MDASQTGWDEPLDALDLSILEELAQAADALDPVPDGFTTEVQFRLSVAALQAEVATLMTPADDLVLRGDLSGAEPARTETLTFAAGELSVMIGVEPRTSGTVRVDGWVTAPDTVVRLRPVDPSADEHVTQADGDGRFAFDEVPTGTVQLVLTPPGVARPVLTPRFEL